MQVGDLIRLTLKDGAITSDTGIFLENEDNYGYKRFLVNGQSIVINILDYTYEVINENR